VRICLFTRVLAAHGLGGGMEVHTAQLAAGLQRQGHEICALTTARPDGKPGVEMGPLTTHFLPAPPTRYSRAWWVASDEVFCRLHAARPFDVVWSQSAGAIGYLLRSRARLGVPCVAIMHGSMRAEWRRRAFGLPSPRSLARVAAQIPSALTFTWLWRRAGPLLDACVAPTEELAHENQAELHLADDRMHVVPWGVDTARFRPQPEAGQAVRLRLGIPADGTVLLSVGRLSQQKGQHLAIEALAQLQEAGQTAWLLLAGTGREGPALQRLARRLGLAERVHFLGQVPQGELPAVYAAADVCVFPWLGAEMFPLTLLEALASGVPPICSAVGSALSILQRGRIGRVVPPGKLAPLAQAVLDLLRAPEERRRMAATARTLAELEYSLETMVARTEAILAARPTPSAAAP